MWAFQRSSPPWSRRRLDYQNLSTLGPSSVLIANANSSVVKLVTAGETAPTHHDMNASFAQSWNGMFGILTRSAPRMHLIAYFGFAHVGASCHHDILEACLVGRSIDIQRRTEVVDHAQPIDVMPRILAAFVLKSHLLPPRQPGPRQSFGDRPHFRAYPLFPRQTSPKLDDIFFMG